ncbi:MAG: PEP/pyruvate-binding domain-containing protein [Patescibacteria group bacterium]|nr:PEP/pyruvate-binding domain-containing protein [Patescibacteria group bacterium]
MQFLKPFKELGYKNVNIAGGKGASLGEMLSAKIPVPDGFVVLSTTFDRFIEETDINIEIDAQLAKVNKDDVNSVDEASRVIQELILKRKMPKDIGDEIMKQFKAQKLDLVAVRSSATAEDSSSASWAGELDSFLMVTEKNLLDCVKRCWASLFTPRAIFYRIEKGMSDIKVSVAVVVQKMVKSEVSGIAFTVHPVTQDKNQMIIEAGYGLGEAIVGGLITPDAYVVDKKSKEIIDINVAEQEIKIVRDSKGLTKESKTAADERESQKLNGKEILELAEICINIERHYKFPCDIEWAREKGKFYIVQSRPITTL